MWNITGDGYNVTYNTEEWKDNVYRYSGPPDYRQGQIVWSRYLFSNSFMGITGSRTIIDRNTGELLAIVAVDYTLSFISDSIAETTVNQYDTRGNINYSAWKSWIFERSIVNDDNDVDGSGHVVVASSDGHLIKEASQVEGCYGFLTDHEDLMLPYDAEVC